MSEEEGDDPRKKKVQRLEKNADESLIGRLNELEIDQDAIKKQHQEVLGAIWEAEPIFELSHKYAEGSGSPA